MDLSKNYRIYTIKLWYQDVNFSQTMNHVRTLRSSSKRLSATVNLADTVLTARGFRHSAVAVCILPDNFLNSTNIDCFKRNVKPMCLTSAFCSLAQCQFLCLNE